MITSSPAGLPVVAVWPDLAADRRARLLDHGALVFEDLGDICGVLGQAGRGEEPPADRPQAGPGQTAPASEDEGEALTYLESVQILAQAGVPGPWRFVVRDRGAIHEAMGAARERFPVVVKGANLRGHKALAGGVVVNIRDAAVLEEALEDLVVKFDGAVIEEQVEPGVDLLIAARRGPFGGLAVLGFGGALADVLGRQVVFSPDLSSDQIDAAVRASRVGAVLRRLDGAGYEASLQVSQLINNICAMLRSERLHEIELNPVIVGPHGPMACDAKVVRSTPL